MTHDQHYSSPGAVEAAIKSAAQKAFAADRSLSTGEYVRLEYFRRFLSRVFSEANDSAWVLKGGTGVLARVGSARGTTDVDLFHRGHSLASALEDLRRLAAVDLGDFFRFEYVGYSEIAGGNQQTYTQGYRVSYDVYIGVKRKETLHVDLVVNVVMTDEAEVASPANALDLPKLQSNPYRLYPVVDQIADKVCATLTLYNGHPSSREKDLVDLVVLAVTQDVSATKLRRALDSESAVRLLTLSTSFSVPATWGRTYARLAKTVPVCEGFRTVADAMNLMSKFLDPVLTGAVSNETWSHSSRRWH
ncbi:MAG TPA: nucleotidyl transferase AbiEii/AbiGii toxin family protein [Arachnia sp.]|nr:nucleotidyl transferase AbiEii/AbiGii toxin family protein [Arachnia sp.]